MNDEQKTSLAENRTDWAEKRTDWAEDRTLLANERTYSGWMRTALAAAVVGLAIEAIFKETEPTWLAKACSSAFILLGIILIINAHINSTKLLDKLNAHAAEPSTNGKLIWVTGLYTVGAFGITALLWMI